jgi:CubicO group peptidase (beta-lactamase class C family)
VAGGLSGTARAGGVRAPVLVFVPGALLPPDLAGGRGHADCAGTPPVRNDPVYRIDSITSQFTAFMLLQLVESGTVELPEPVAKYVPEIAAPCRRDPRWAALAPGQLATQTAGAP